MDYENYKKQFEFHPYFDSEQVMNLLDDDGMLQRINNLWNYMKDSWESCNSGMPDKCEEAIELVFKLYYKTVEVYVETATDEERDKLISMVK